MQLSQEQINWLLYNINKDKEEQYKIIENVVEILKYYINPEMYREEQKNKKEKQHKTSLDDNLKEEFKNKGLSDEQLKQLETFFKE